MAVVNVSASVALAPLSASTTVTTTVSPDRYAASLLRRRPAGCVGVVTGVGDGVVIGVGDGVSVGSGSGKVVVVVLVVVVLVVVVLVVVLVVVVVLFPPPPQRPPPLDEVVVWLWEALVW